MKTVPIIQFPERNISAKDLKLTPGALLVRSIFYTLQGEGPYAGYPAVFVRFGGCNRGAKVDCQWCDTDFRMDKSKLMTVEQIVAQVRSYRNPQALDKPLVVLTGGEPLLHDLTALTTALHDLGYITQMETNGDLLRVATLPRTVMVVSPKVSARAHRYTRPHKEVLLRADYLKVLVTVDESSPYHELPEYVYDFADQKGSHHVFVSPISEYARTLEPGEMASMWNDIYDKEKCRANHHYAATLARDKAFRLTVQMHTFVELE